jgi:uncharacterized membrane protein
MSAKKQKDTRSLLSALPYILWPVALVLLIIQETKDKQDKLLRHHAYNAIGFIAGILILSIPVWLLAGVPVFGEIIATIYWLGAIILAIVFALRAYQGEKVEVPITTEFMRNNIKNF